MRIEDQQFVEDQLDGLQKVIREQILTYMEKNKLSERKFAMRCDISVKELRRIMYGDRLFFPDLWIVAKAMEIKVSQFVYDMEAAADS